MKDWKEEQQQKEMVEGWKKEREEAKMARQRVRDQIARDKSVLRFCCLFLMLYYTDLDNVMASAGM